MVKVGWISQGKVCNVLLLTLCWWICGFITEEYTEFNHILFSFILRNMPLLEQLNGWMSAKIGFWLVCGVSTCKALHKIQLFHYTRSNYKSTSLQIRLWETNYVHNNHISQWSHFQLEWDLSGLIWLAEDHRYTSLVLSPSLIQSAKFRQHVFLILYCLSMIKSMVLMRQLKIHRAVH